MNRISTLLLLIALFGVIAAETRPVFAQAGLRDSLEKLDRNKDGQISPEEITPLARPYLERVARARRISLERPNSIERLQEAARTYYAIQNGVYGTDIRPEGKSTVSPFGPEKDKNVVPEFGLPNMKYAYNQEDLDEADQTLRRYDRNRDGFIDRNEARRSRWTHRSPFEMDLNQDDRLSRLELTQRYARRRMTSDDVGELIQKARRTGSGEASPLEVSRIVKEQWSEQFGKLRYVVSSVLGRFDLNRNGQLELSEAEAMGVSPGIIDKDRDGEISRDELHAYLATLQGEEGDDVEGLPSWFFALDANRDKQVAMAEFTEQWTEAKLQEFASLDLNGDGLLTTSEAIQSKAVVGGGYRNDTAEILPPRKTIISEIEVEEDYVIGDLDVELSITHSHISQLDGYLVGPEGQRIELFTEVGGSGDHFDRTIFDDQSPYPITKAKPPYRNRFLPEGLLNRQPGLSQFKGKSAKGAWQLIIRGARNDRFGMLHSWALIVQPQDASGATVLSTYEPEPSARPSGRGAEGSRRPESKAVSRSESGSPKSQRLGSSYGDDRAKPDREALIQKYVNAAREKSGGKMSEEDLERYRAIIERKMQNADSKRAGSKFKKKELGDKRQKEDYKREKSDSKKRGDDEKRMKKTLRKDEKVKR